MKTGPGRMEQYVPSPRTVGRDVRAVFISTRLRLATMLQVRIYNGEQKKTYLQMYQNYPGALNFATDAWTSPNHKPYIAITIHFERKGKATTMVLDVVALMKRHTGHNLAEVFLRVLEDFGIQKKVSKFVLLCRCWILTCYKDISHYLQQRV